MAIVGSSRGVKWIGIVRLVATAALLFACSNAVAGDQPLFSGSWVAECATDTFYAPAAVAIATISNGTNSTNATRALVRRHMWELVSARHNIVPYTGGSKADAWDALKFLSLIHI